MSSCTERYRVMPTNMSPIWQYYLINVSHIRSVHALNALEFVRGEVQTNMSPIWPYHLIERA